MFRRDRSGPRRPYFIELQRALRREGMTEPTLVLDRARLRQNIARLKADLGKGVALRVVAKSLPVPQLLSEVTARLGTNRYMTFNLPMLRQVAELDPDADQVLGKPLPVAAAARFYSCTPATALRPRIAWLIDSPARFAQYAELARSQGLTIDIVLELDVGLHRGGFAPGPELAGVLNGFSQEPALNLAGVMGYDAHIAKVPRALGLRDRAHAHARRSYLEVLEMVRSTTGIDPDRLAVRNAGGSPTFRLYPDTSVANEVSVGSALVKPTDFDIDLLDAYAPALFIATPAIKVGGPMKTPIIEKLDPLKNWLDPNLARTVFIHGGHWKAGPVDPPGLRYNATYGRSSNQEVLTAGKRCDLDLDDLVFLRPTQSEAVMLQFGPVALYDEGAIVDRWTPFPIC